MNIRQMEQHQAMAWVNWALGVVLLAYFFAVYRPLSRHAQQLDQPLDDLSQRYGLLELVEGPGRGMSLEDIHQNLTRIQQDEMDARVYRDRLLEQVTLPDLTMAQSRVPFQLIEFQNHRQLSIEKLQGLAKQSKVKVTPETYQNLPDFELDEDRPGFLWVRLTLAVQVLERVMEAGVQEIHQLQVLPEEVRANPFAEGISLDEVPIQVECSGDMQTISAWLAALPVSREGTETAERRPALFLDRIMLIKENPKALAQVRARVTLKALVYPKP